MAENDARLRELMARHGLTHKEVADLLHVSSLTVTNWLRPEENAAKRNMPLASLELLEYKLKERS